MKNRSILIAFLLMIAVASVCRVMGFAPQIAMAIFAGAMIRDKKLSFVLPLISMFFSDLLYEVLFIYGYAPYGGFYEGQLINYILIALVTVVGFWVKGMNWGRMFAASFAGTTFYFALSNFFVWLGFGGWARPQTIEGLMMTYADALPFYRNAVISTLVFSVILFGGYYLVQRFYLQRKQQLA